LDKAFRLDGSQETSEVSCVVKKKRPENAPKFGAFGFTKFTMNDFSAVHLANTNVPSLRECGWYDWYYWYQQQVG